MVEAQVALTLRHELLNALLEVAIRVEAVKHFLPRALLLRVCRDPLLRGVDGRASCVTHKEVHQAQGEAEEGRAKRAPLVQALFRDDVGLLVLTLCG
jgi:hypothetical protein